MSIQTHSVSSAMELTNVPIQQTNYMPNLNDENEDTVQKMECRLTSRNNTGQPIIVQVEHIIRSKPKSTTEKPQFGATFSSSHSKKCKSPKTNSFTPEQERKTIAAIIDLSSKDEEIAGVTATKQETSPEENPSNDPRLISGADQTTGYDAHSHLPPSSADSSIDDVAQRLARMPWHPHPPEDEYEISCCGWKKVKKPPLNPGVATGPWDLHPPAVNTTNLQNQLEDQMSVDSNWPPEMPDHQSNPAECYCVDHNDVWLNEQGISNIKNSNSDECYCHGPKMNIPLPLYEQEMEQNEDFQLGNYTGAVVIQEDKPKEIKSKSKDQLESVSSQENEKTEDAFSWQDPQIFRHDNLQPQCDQLSITQQHCEPLHHELYEGSHEDSEPPIQMSDNLVHHQWHCEPRFTPDQGDSAYNSYEKAVPLSKPHLLQENPSIMSTKINKNNTDKYETFSQNSNWIPSHPRSSLELVLPPTPPLKSSTVSPTISEENREIFPEFTNGIGAFNIYSNEAMSSKLAEKMIKKVHPPSPPTSKREGIIEPTIRIPQSKMKATANLSATSPRLNVIRSPDENWKKVSKITSPAEQESHHVENYESESLISSPSITLPPTPDKRSPDPEYSVHSETPASDYLTPSPKCKSLINHNSPNIRSPSKGSREFFETQRYPTPMELQNAPCMSVPEMRKVPECGMEAPKFGIKVSKCTTNENKCGEMAKCSHSPKCTSEVLKCVNDQCCSKEVPRCYDVPSCPQDVPRCYDIPSCPQDVPRCYDIPSCPQDVPRCYDIPSCPQDVPRCYDIPSCPQNVPRCYDIPIYPQEVQRCLEVPMCSDVPEYPESGSCPRLDASEWDCLDRDINSAVPSCHCLPTVTDNSSLKKQLNFSSKRKCEKPPSEPLPEVKKVYSPSFNKSHPCVHLESALSENKTPLFETNINFKDNQSLVEDWNSNQSPQFQQYQSLERDSQVPKNPFLLLRQPNQHNPFWQDSEPVNDTLNFTHDSLIDSNQPDFQTLKHETWKEYSMAAKKNYPWLYSKNDLPKRRTPTCQCQVTHLNQSKYFDNDQQLIGSLIHCCDFVCPQKQQSPRNCLTSPCQLVKHQPSTPPISLQKPFCYPVGNIKPGFEQTLNCKHESPNSILNSKIVINCQQPESTNCDNELIRESSIQEASPLKSKLKLDNIQVKEKSKMINIQPLTEKQTAKSVNQIKKSSSDVKLKSSKEQLRLETEDAEHLNIAPREITPKKMKKIISPTLCRHSEFFLDDGNEDCLYISSTLQSQQQYAEGTSQPDKNNPITKFQSPRSRNINWEWHPQAFVVCPTVPVKQQSKPTTTIHKLKFSRKSVMLQHLEINPDEQIQCKPKIYHHCSAMCNVQQFIPPLDLTQTTMMCNTQPYPKPQNEMHYCQSTFLQPIHCSCNSGLNSSQLQQMSMQSQLEKDLSIAASQQNQILQSSLTSAKFEVPQNNTTDNMQCNLTNDARFSSHSRIPNFSQKSNLTTFQLPSQEQETRLQRQVILQPRGRLSTIPQERSESQLFNNQQQQNSKTVMCQNQETQTIEIPKEPLHYILESHYQLHPRNKSVATETSEIDFTLGLDKLGKLFADSNFPNLKLGDLPLNFTSSKSFQSHNKTSNKSSSSEVSFSKFGKKNKQKVFPCSLSDTSTKQSKNRSKSCCHSISQCQSNTESLFQQSNSEQSDIKKTKSIPYGSYQHSKRESLRPLQSHKEKYNQQIHKHCSYASSVSPSTVSLPTTNIQSNTHCWCCHQPLNSIPVPSQSFGHLNHMPERFQATSQPMNSSQGPTPQLNFFKIAFVPVQCIPQSPHMIPRLCSSNYPSYGVYPVFEDVQSNGSATSSNASVRSSPTNAYSRQHVCMPEETEIESYQQQQEMCSCHDDHESEYSIANSSCVTPTPFDSHLSQEIKKRHYCSPQQCDVNMEETQSPDEYIDNKSHFHPTNFLMEKLQDEPQQGRQTCSVSQFGLDKNERIEEQNQNYKFRNCQCSNAKEKISKVCSKFKFPHSIISPLLPQLAHSVPTSQSLPTEFDQNVKGRTLRMKKSPRLNKSPTMDMAIGRSMAEGPSNHLQANSSISEPLINGYQTQKVGLSPSTWNKRLHHYHSEQSKTSHERSVSCIASKTPNSPKLKCACSVLAFSTSPTSQADPCPAESPELDRPSLH